MSLRLPPKRVGIGRHVWRIKWGDPTGEVFDADKDWGSCVASERTIYLHPRLRLSRNRKRLWTTLVHEILHGEFPELRHEQIYWLDWVGGVIFSGLLGAEPAARKRARSSVRSRRGWQETAPVRY